MKSLETSYGLISPTPRSKVATKALRRKTNLKAFQKCGVAQVGFGLYVAVPSVVATPVLDLRSRMIIASQPTYKEKWVKNQDQGMEARKAGQGAFQKRLSIAFGSILHIPDTLHSQH